MSIRFSKKLAMLLAVVLCVPILWNHSTQVASAATTPTFAKSRIDLVGVGQIYQVEIKDKVTGSTYKWSSSDTKIVKVSSKGVLTTVKGGSVTIKCVITYPTKKTKTLSCKVYVTVPSTEIKISNATEVKGANIMTLGTTFDFESVLTPAVTTDKVYWSVGHGDKECIRIDDAENGVVTATKLGKVTLVASAVQTVTAADAKKSIVNDAIIIEVVGPTATVRSADIVSSDEIKVVFDSPVDKSTIIDSSNKLTSNITLSLVSGSASADPGTLTPSLSADMTTLTITSKNLLSGVYGINFTEGIKTTGGVAMEPYYKQLSYVDKTPPQTTMITLDDTGYITKIQFSEPIDITNLKASNAQPTSGGSQAESATLSILNNKLNYILSGDKKTLSINLSTIASTDYNKTFSVVLSGIKDLAGNAPANVYFTVIVRTDTTPKPQAVPYSLVRTSYNVVTATFSRGIKTPGMLSLNGGAYVTGVVDIYDNKKVNYTISEADTTLTGNVKAFVAYWDSYNVVTTDTTADYGRTMNVNFTSDTVKPVLISYEFDADNSYLTLTFSEAVKPEFETGVIMASIKTLTDEIQPGNNINYTTEAVPDNDKVVKLKLNNMSILGTYTFTLEEGFVIDAFRNRSASRQFAISNGTSTSTELPGPYAIVQSSTKLNQINVEFANRIDVASAQNISNYSIAGVTVIAAQVEKNTNENGATVVLTIADNSVEVTVERPVTIKGIMGYNGSFSAITTFSGSVTLQENKKPYLVSTTFDRITMDTILMNFSEQIQGSISVKVTELTTGIEIGSNATVSGSTVSIKLNYVPSKGSYLRVQIDPLSTNITDTSGNSVAAMNSVYGVVASY